MGMWPQHSPTEPQARTGTLPKGARCYQSSDRPFFDVAHFSRPRCHRLSPPPPSRRPPSLTISSRSSPCDGFAAVAPSAVAGVRPSATDRPRILVSYTRQPCHFRPTSQRSTVGRRSLGVSCRRLEKNGRVLYQIPIPRLKTNARASYLRISAAPSPRQRARRNQATASSAPSLARRLICLFSALRRASLSAGAGRLCLPYLSIAPP